VFSALTLTSQFTKWLVDWKTLQFETLKWTNVRIFLLLNENNTCIEIYIYDRDYTQFEFRTFSNWFSTIKLQKIYYYYNCYTLTRWTYSCLQFPYINKTIAYITFSKITFYTSPRGKLISDTIYIIYMCGYVGVRFEIVQERGMVMSSIYIYPKEYPLGTS